MKKSATDITPKIIRKVDSILARVRKADTYRRNSIRRFAPYGFLKRVLAAYLDLKEQGLLKTLRFVATKKWGVAHRSNWHPLRTIIEATTKHPDLKIKSRWTRALELAVLKRVKPCELTTCFKNNGGIAGCARIATKHLRKRKNTLDCWSDNYQKEDRGNYDEEDWRNDDEDEPAYDWEHEYDENSKVTWTK